MNVTARLALQIIPEHLRNEPVFLCIDDTMIAKFDKKFEDVSKLFDHAAHNGSNYLNGHCFLSLMLCIPVWKKNRIVYQSIPLGYRMRTKEVSKLELAADMVRAIMPELQQKHQVLLLFDSWYAKKVLVCLAYEYENLDIICNTSVLTRLYLDKPPCSLSHWTALPSLNDVTASPRSGALPMNDIVNIGLHFFLKDVRTMLLPVMNHNIAVA